MFYGDIVITIPEPKEIERSAGGQRSLEEAARLIATAKRPVIVSGCTGLSKTGFQMVPSKFHF